MLDKARIEIEKLLDPFADELGLDIIELKVFRRNRSVVVELLADRPSGGITIDECTKLNRFLSGKIEELQILSNDYSLEVSSPGLDRPLKTEKDFLRNLGKRIVCRLKEAIDEQNEFTGELSEVRGDQIILQVNTHAVSIPIDQIGKAVQVIHLR